MKKVFVLCMIAVLVLTCTTACTKKENDASSASQVILNGDEIYPVKCDDELTFWGGWSEFLQADYADMSQTPLGKALEEQTGVKIKYIHPSSAQQDEQFNILLASDDMPDIINHHWNTYSGGPDKAIQEKYIIPLNDLLEKYMPSLNKIINDNPDIAREMKTDSGNYYAVPFIRGDEWLTTYSGLILRKDWLDKAGLELPKTVDEFETVLSAFKKYSNSAPLVLSSGQIGNLIRMYNTDYGFYLDNGKVKYGPLDSNYRDAVVNLKKWYDGGLIDKNFLSADSKYINAAVLNDDSGAYFSTVVSGIGNLLEVKPYDSFDLVAAPNLTIDGSEVPEFSTISGRVDMNVGAAISTDCKNVELAARFLDFGYSEKGHMLYNFGIEGESYTMVDGYPKLTSLLTDNPDGLGFERISSRYLKAGSSGLFVQDSRFVEQSLRFPKQQMEAYKTWSNTNMREHLMPSITLKADEVDEAANLENDITTYVKENTISFIIGKRDIAEYDDFINEINKLGIEKLTSMKQSALERYNKR